MSDPYTRTTPTSLRGGNGQDPAVRLVVRGIGVSPGIAMGPAFRFMRAQFTAEEGHIDAALVEQEVERFDRAVLRAERDLRKIGAVAREKIGEESAAVFEAQVLMLRDPQVYDQICASIRTDHTNAEYAVEQAVGRVRRVMEAAESEYLRERTNDLLDLQQRLVRHLQRGSVLSRIHPNHVVVAENLSAADIILFSRRDVLGCVSDFGGPTSHVAIMARALGVPAIVGVHELSAKVRTGDFLILDGFQGQVLVNPDEATIERYRDKQRRYERLKSEQAGLLGLPSQTQDGYRVVLQANVEFDEELPLLDEVGAEGIGLFRTEFLFLMRGMYLTEEEQFETYKQVVEHIAPRPTTFRLIDLGGDKVMPMAHREHNPFLGWRGIRILMDRPELLQPQLRALLRASAFGTVHILLPMISAMEELKAMKVALNEARATLDERGQAYDEDVALGIMVEVPSVALMAAQFAREVDFFSIGSNDLTQYVLAVDRGNDLVGHKYSELHPAVLGLIANTVRAAHREGIPVSICGEMAGRPHNVPLLVGLGLDALSASPSYLPNLKRVVRELDFEDAQQIAAEALTCRDAAGVHLLLNTWLQEHLPGLADVFDGKG